MRQESLPPIKEVHQALENAATDLYGFAFVCHGGGGPFAEPAVLDALLLGLENSWFTEEGSGVLSHREFREDFFRALWERCQGAKGEVMVGTEVPLGHEEMAFYRLPQLARAALFLRARKRFDYLAIALILGVSEGEARQVVEKAREQILGRSLKSVEWTEEDF